MTGDQALDAVERIRATLARYQEHDRYAKVNAQQVMDLLDPEGMWSFSQGGTANVD